MAGIKNNPTITNEEIININRSAIEHRATWMGLSFEEAIKAGVNGEKILRAAVSQTGCLHGTIIREKLEEPVRLDKFADAFLSQVAIKTFEMEFKTRTPETLEINFHYCPLVAGWLKAGIPLKDIPILCDIAMDGDRNIATTAGVDFSLGKTIANGDVICEVSFYKKEKE
jgi:hypothetical protein